MVALEIVIARRAGATLQLVPWTVAGCTAVTAGIFAHARKRRRRASWNEIAERLDLAVGDQNATATALDLLRNHEIGEMASLAVENGIVAAKEFGSERPTLGWSVIHRRQNLLVTAASLIVIALAW